MAPNRDLGHRMTSVLQRAFVCATWACVVLALSACHDVSKEVGVSPALSANAPAAAMTIVGPEGGASNDDFAGEGEMQDETAPRVVSMQPPTLDSASADSEEFEDCKVWALTSEDAEAFFSMSRPIDSGTWNEEHDAPCAINGVVHSNGVDWQFSINGANKAMLRSGKAVRYLDCDSRECEQFGS